MGDSASDSGQDTNEFTTDAELNQIASDAAQIANDRDTGREDTTDSLTARDLQQIENRASGRSANTQSFTEQSQNYVDDFSGANRGSLPTSRSPFTASLPSTFERDYTKDYSDFNFANSNAAQGLREGAKGIGLPSFFPAFGLINSITSLPSQMTLNDLYRGQVPTYTDGMITGTKDFGFGNDPNVYPSIFADTAPQVQSFDNTINDGSDNNDPEIIRRRMAGEVIPEEELDPVLSDDLAVNYLQNPNYLYSGQGNLYQPYGYAQGTLVDLLRTRNLTQPQQAAANLGLFGNPGDFS